MNISQIFSIVFYYFTLCGITFSTNLNNQHTTESKSIVAAKNYIINNIATKEAAIRNENIFILFHDTDTEVRKNAVKIRFTITNHNNFAEIRTILIKFKKIHDNLPYSD